ncbi:hypothetical protein Pmani_016284 [Petrolisthes manimaculis]|uniref:Uncharacterized protein n=1 Tax=Petrolisthes manimaculis TaxID=1843537 RepID=A0AAE1PDZ0_9EUCA|nr:hypothetical protein Pmani_022425 [Petrolisthes manimaculis]KAK4312273.1 hypothetical protein Pmani_016284 [Petrolisthes manimaculis]
MYEGHNARKGQYFLLQWVYVFRAALLYEYEKVAPQARMSLTYSIGEVGWEVSGIDCSCMALPIPRTTPHQEEVAVFFRFPLRSSPDLQRFYP